MHTDNTTYHFVGFLSLGGGFLGIRKRARIGCISQRAETNQVHLNRELQQENNNTGYKYTISILAHSRSLKEKGEWKVRGNLILRYICSTNSINLV